MTVAFSTFSVADYLDNDDIIAEYLTVAIEDSNPDIFLAALAEVVKARGMAQVAGAAGLCRESLDKALAPGSHPRFETISAIMRALHLKIYVQPITSELS